MLQYHGLNTWARDLLSETIEAEEKGERIFSNGESEPFARTVFLPVYKATVLSALDDTDSSDHYMLHRYDFMDGTAYEEYVQSVSWYGGPCYFIALKKDGEVVAESLWQKEEMKVG